MPSTKRLVVFLTNQKDYEHCAVKHPGGGFFVHSFNYYLFTFHLMSCVLILILPKAHIIGTIP